MRCNERGNNGDGDLCHGKVLKVTIHASNAQKNVIVLK